MSNMPKMAAFKAAVGGAAKMTTIAAAGDVAASSAGGWSPSEEADLVSHHLL